MQARPIWPSRHIAAAPLSAPEPAGQFSPDCLLPMLPAEEGQHWCMLPEPRGRTVRMSGPVSARTRAALCPPQKGLGDATCEAILPVVIFKSERTTRTSLTSRSGPRGAKEAAPGGNAPFPSAEPLNPRPLTCPRAPCSRACSSSCRNGCLSWGSSWSFCPLSADVLQCMCASYQGFAAIRGKLACSNLAPALSPLDSAALSRCPQVGGASLKEARQDKAKHHPSEECGVHPAAEPEQGCGRRGFHIAAPLPHLRVWLRVWLRVACAAAGATKMEKGPSDAGARENIL
jgi:hypothetical protein